MSIEIWGPSFWQDNYGISTSSQFQDEVGSLIPTVLPFGNLGANKVALETAYAFPYGDFGLAAQAALTLKGYSADQKTAGNALLQILINNVNIGKGTTMGQLIIPDCFQVAIEAVSGSQNVINVIGVRNAGGTAAGAAAAVKAAWEGTGGPMAQMSAFYAMVNYHAVDISSSMGSQADLASSKTGSVSTTNSLATVGAAALIKWNGSTRSRSTRGRLYFGPIMETNINPDGRTLVTSSQTAITTAFNTFLASLSTAGYPLVVLSRTLSQAFTVTTLAVEPVIATQRRRIRS